MISKRLIKSKTGVGCLISIGVISLFSIVVAAELRDVGRYESVKVQHVEIENDIVTIIFDTPICNPECTTDTDDTDKEVCVNKSSEAKTISTETITWNSENKHRVFDLATAAMLAHSDVRVGVYDTSGGYCVLNSLRLK